MNWWKLALVVLSVSIPTNADLPLAGGVKGNPVLIQGSRGNKGNFEAVIASTKGGFFHYWRDNERPERPWNGPNWVRPDLQVDGLAFIQSSFGDPGNLEVLINSGGRLIFGWRESDLPLRWTFSDAELFAQRVRGVPSLIQSNFGDPGNFEMATPLENGGIGMYGRNNSAPNFPWSGPVVIGDTQVLYDAVSLIQSNYNDGNLEVIGKTESGLLHHFWRDTPTGPWQGPKMVGRSVGGAPVLIQSKYGDKGNFEILYPDTDGTLRQSVRNNDTNPPSWNNAVVVPTPGIEKVEAVSFIQGNYGDPGNFEILVRGGENLYAFYRDNNGFRPPGLVSSPVDILFTPPPFTKAFTEHLGRLSQTPLNPIAKMGMGGFDLGASFESSDGLHFLFGDTRVYDDRNFNDDSIAVTNARKVDRFKLPKLTWATGPNNRWVPLTIPQEKWMGAMEVPTDGFELGGRNYFFFATGWDEGVQNYRNSGLASIVGNNPATLVLHHRADSIRFNNISVLDEPDGMYVFGAGAYRGSSVYLAKVSKSQIRERGAWRFFRGMRNGDPTYGEREESSFPVVHANCVGEFSVRKHAPTGLYLMTYNCDNGILLRTAAKPWGPWSEPIVIYDRTPNDHGYNVSMHQDFEIAGFEDGLDDYWREPGIDNKNGGCYGAYLVPRWFTTRETGVYDIVYTLSTWNSYQVHLMRTTLKLDPSKNVPRPVYGAEMPPTDLVNAEFADGLNGWKMEGGPFQIVEREGRKWLLTFAEGGDKTKGRLSQTFFIDSHLKEMSFVVYGGHGYVRLYHGEEMVRETKAHEDNDKFIPVRWNVSNLRGEKVTLTIDDQADDIYGFIGVSGITLVNEGSD